MARVCLVSSGGRCASRLCSYSTAEGPIFLHTVLDFDRFLRLPQRDLVENEEVGEKKVKVQHGILRQVGRSARTIKSAGLQKLLVGCIKAELEPAVGGFYI